jgi:transposase
VPTPYPKEFRADVVAVARQGDKSRAQVARSFGISESCLARWLRIADREDGAPPPAASEPSSEWAVYGPTPANSPTTRR